MLEAYQKGRERKEEIIDIAHTKEYEALQIDRTEEHTRAYIKVQDSAISFVPTV